MCGKHGRYDGWYNSTFEKMAAYRQSTGIMPFGPHREFADRLLGRRMKPCRKCKGRGLLNATNGSDWQICPRCQGSGYSFTGSSGLLESLRARIMEAYPAIWSHKTQEAEPESTPEEPGAQAVAAGSEPAARKAVKSKKARRGHKKKAGVKSRTSKPITRPIRRRAST